MAICYLIDFNGEPSVPSWGIGCGSQDASGLSIEVAPDLIECELGLVPVQEVVYWQMAKRSRKTAQTKLIGEVTATKRKPWRQKGTGRARHGNLSAPQFRGGAVAFGPRNRECSHSVNKKLRRRALAMVISLKAAMGMLSITRGNPAPEIKTSALLEKLAVHVGLQDRGSLIYCVEECSRELALSSRNLPNVHVISVAGLNVRDVLASDVLLIDERAVDSVVRRLEV